MSDRRIHVAIVGCGRIGTQWDSPVPGLQYSMTHAAAFTRNPRSYLAAVCDSDRSLAEAAARRWASPSAYADPTAMFVREKIDLLVVATSSAIRWSVIEPALAAGIKFFVIEKPMAVTLDESDVIIRALKAAGARAIVNFSRRWDPAMRGLRAQIEAGDFGALQRLVGLYGKGVLNNGSHMIDLASMLCSANATRVRSLGSPLPRSESLWSKEADPTLDAQLIFTTENGSEIQLDMLGTDQSAFTCFELRILGTDATGSVTAGGRAVAFSRIIPDPDFPSYKIPGAFVTSAAKLPQSMDAMAAEAIEMACGRIERVSCDADSAIKVSAIVDAIKRSESEHGRWIAISTTWP